ncbi:MAG TPA: ABC transporter ATP-binding protein [Acidimicrobiales bacterium]|nr:ABC transporter ATP-binding protein [Acidimicrobiales bacterium]
MTVELRGITKRFGRVVACRDVHFAVREGEIHGLLGENGAGKSTLMKLLIGLVPSDGGEVHLRGRPVAVKDPVHAASLGLAMAQQHFSLVERLRVWENVALAHRGKLKRRDVARAIGEIGERYGITTDANARVEDLTVGQRQRVELIKCLSLKPEVLILDEPTSVLTRAESRDLFSVLRQVVHRDGLSVILISHKLDEILQATDLVTIMRDGSVVASLPTEEADAHQLAKAMVGREVLLQAEMAAIGLLEEDGDLAGAAGDLAAGDLAAARPAQPGQPAQPTQPGRQPAGGVRAAPVTLPAGPPAATAPALRLDQVTVRGADGQLLLDGLSVEVRPGEIVGVAGVDGNGQSTIGDVMSGIATLEGGTVEVGGDRVPVRAADLLRAGVGVIPEDRHASGCILRMSVAENLVATDLDSYRARTGLLDRGAIRRRAAELMAEYAIAAPSPDVPMAALSGGNQQRVVVARELTREPKVLIAVQPSRGLDVGAIEFISERLMAAAGRGVGILLVSSELDELLALSHRIVVIHGGRIVGEMPRNQIDVERLGLLMGGRVA